MQKSIKLAFLSLILTSVAAPAVCASENKTAPSLEDILHADQWARQEVLNLQPQLV